eukprot:scaffold40680_cov60-Phaeocystis_antarctica.AAC.5
MSRSVRSCMSSPGSRHSTRAHAKPPPSRLRQRLGQSSDLAVVNCSSTCAALCGSRTAVTTEEPPRWRRRRTSKSRPSRAQTFGRGGIRTSRTPSVGASKCQQVRETIQV